MAYSTGGNFSISTAPKRELKFSKEILSMDENLFMFHDVRYIYGCTHLLHNNPAQVIHVGELKQAASIYYPD